MTTNEAAERLRSKPEQRLIGLIDFQPTDTKIAMRTALAGALRAERRATVERLWNMGLLDENELDGPDDALRVLDEEAAR